MHYFIITLALVAFTPFQAHAATCDVPNAVANDGIDDLIPIQLALYSGCAHLGPGTYDVVGKVPGSRWDALILRGATLRGSGPATVIRFSGDAGGNDWRGLSLYADDNLVADITLDTSGLTNTEEQTHAIHLTGPTQRNTIRGVTINHPSRGPSSSNLGGGDCIKIASYPTAQSTTQILNNHFRDCDRSGIATVGGFHGMVISNNTFYATGDSDLDVEANGAGSDLIVTSNVFLLGKPGISAIAVSLSAPLIERVVFSNNTLEGRGVFVMGGQRMAIANNIIEQRQGFAPTLHVIKNSQEVLITGNVITRTAPADPNPVVKIVNHGTSSPGTVVFSSNIVRNSTNIATCLLVQSASDLLVSGNQFEWRPLAPVAGIHVLVGVYGAIRKVETFLFAGNVMRGSARPLTFNAKDAGVGRVVLQGNTAIGHTEGVQCQDVAANPLGPIVSSGNNWPAVVPGNCVFRD